MKAPYNGKIRAFNSKHGIETQNQFDMLAAEVGELAEAHLKDDDAGVREECADVVFVAQSIGLLEREFGYPNESFGKAESLRDAVDEVKLSHGAAQREWAHRRSIHNLYLLVKACYTLAATFGFDLDAAVSEVAEENLGKSASREGNKVTKE